MSVTDQIRILDREIMQNEAQYDLDRKATKIYELSSNNLDKYELLTGEYLGLKPSTVEQGNFEYSPLGKVFTKGLDKDDKKEGFLKRLKNNEDKNEEQLKAIGYHKTKNINKTNCETSNPLLYNSKHSFYKYRLIEFIKISSFDSKYHQLIL